jgi:dipeptidyl aminopeptidase/acylaminoacyl peptidase
VGLVVGCGGATMVPKAAPAEPVPPEAAVTPVPAEPPSLPAYTGLGAASVTPELIQKFAAPPLDPGVSSRIQSMLDVRGTGGGFPSSSGDRIVFTWRITGTNQVWRQDLPMGFPVQLTGGEDSTSVVDLSPDDRFLVVSRDRGGQENPGLYLLDVYGGPLVEIQHKTGVQTLFAFVSDDSRFVYFLANDVDRGSYVLYRWEKATRLREAIFSQPGLWRVADHLGTRVLLAKWLGNTHAEFYALELESRTLTPLFGQDDNEEYDAMFGAKPETVLVRTNKVGDFHRLYEWKAGALIAITDEIKHDVAYFRIDETRRRVLYGVSEDGYERLYALDGTTYKPLTLPALPDAENVYGGATSHNGRFTQLSYDSATQPPVSMSYDWKAKRLITWRVPSAPEVDVSRFAKASLEFYPARDGTSIPMFVRRPERCDEPCPILVHFHGGPEGQTMPGFNSRAQIFVDAGFVLVEPNVRGSRGYGKSWLHADDGAKRLDIITDIEDCALYLRRAWAKAGKEPKIGVMGGSYGGYSTLMAMSYFAGAYDVAVAEVGISNLVTFLMNTAPYRRILRISEYGDPEKDRDALVKLSPVTYVDRVKAPLLLIQGVNDPRVPVGEAVQIHAALEARGVEGGLILFPDEGHGTSKRANQVLSLGHTLAFFEKYLKGR